MIIAVCRLFFAKSDRNISFYMEFTQFVLTRSKQDLRKVIGVKTGVYMVLLTKIAQ